LVDKALRNSHQHEFIVKTNEKSTALN